MIGKMKEQILVILRMRYPSFVHPCEIEEELKAAVPIYRNFFEKIWANLFLPPMSVREFNWRKSMVKALEELVSEKRVVIGEGAYIIIQGGANEVAKIGAN
jgi:hypothetical protein